MLGFGLSCGSADCLRIVVLCVWRIVFPRAVLLPGGVGFRGGCACDVLFFCFLARIVI